MSLKSSSVPSPLISVADCTCGSLRKPEPTSKNLISFCTGVLTSNTITAAISRSDVSFVVVLTNSPLRTRCTSSLLKSKSAISSSNVGKACAGVAAPHRMNATPSAAMTRHAPRPTTFRFDDCSIVSSVVVLPLRARGFTGAGGRQARAHTQLCLGSALDRFDHCRKIIRDDEVAAAIGQGKAVLDHHWLDAKFECGHLAERHVADAV